ncbi:hypothetical protein LTR73_004670 [Friedmanniomyces endolithicus]|nr:hypothetical protein LTR73_004670 [Friedmanniomyces endolithicus]
MEPMRGDLVVKGRSCEDDRCKQGGSKVWFCVDCDSGFCEHCWDLQAQHKLGKVARDGYKHEKAHYGMLKVYQDILQPPATPGQLRQLHDDDTDTLWFGVTKDESGVPRFEDHGRYASLMANSPSTSGTNTAKYPQLVSFVGVTNAGKSSVVKMLIDRHKSNDPDSMENDFPSPVVGSAVNDRVPTSGDVHLYADPYTFQSRTPRLYADCEGLEGGESIPYGAQSRKRTDSFSNSGKLKKHSAKRLQGRPRNIAWADNDLRRKREYTVTELYPRLLYTFSDVIVFVLRNAKTFQSAVLTKLLQWGAAGLEKSLNQPTLPHAVIVLNATEMGIEEEEWNPKTATASLLKSLSTALDRIGGVPELQDLANTWRSERHTEIRTVRDLIERYYASFTVVRIPAKGRYTLMDKQFNSLLQVINVNCRESLETKRRARMLSNTDEWNIYLQAGFDHFTSNLDTPFNFIEVSLKNNPLPENFGDHIRQLATAILAVYPDPKKTSGQWIFENLGSMVASCILLDCVQYRKGTAEDLFERYEYYLETALEEFCGLHWPCAYENRRGRCVTAALRHNPKGHQNAAGKIIGPGVYQSEFSADSYIDRWVYSVKTRLLVLQTSLQARDDSTPKTFTAIDNVLDIHRHQMSSFYRVLGGAQYFVSHTTCFSCLKQAPEHGLPCGHVLCSACVQAYSKKHSECYVVLESCPLHPVPKFEEPWRVAYKPEYAGVRLLSLDGGGIRGIVELETLRAIETALGPHCKLPIRAFFDLIVGTSTGGIVALAVGVKQWPIRECINVFMDLCQKAFTEREFAGIWGLEQAATLNHGSKWKTKPLHEALADALGPDKLFGGMRELNASYPIKVAVTSTSGTGRKPLVLANYSRAEGDSPPYEFLRRAHPDLELGLCEAAAATSAAPGYFKAYYHKPTTQDFLDGALYYNNPVQVVHREAMLIWPDVAESHPDLLLSIGTGMNHSALKTELRDLPKHMVEPLPVAQTVEDLKQANEATHSRLKAFVLPKHRRVLKTFEALCQRFDSILNAELAWQDFGRTVHRSDWPNIEPLPFIRLNVDLKEDPPALDAKDELATLQGKVKKALHHSASMRVEIQRVAFQLIASTFYVSRAVPLRDAEGTNAVSCRGKVCCRFEDGSLELRELGSFMQSQQHTTAQGSFQPYFVVHEERCEGYILKATITPAVIEGMITQATFSIDIMEFDISNSMANTNIALGLYSAMPDLGHKEYPLSGFPRCLRTAETRKLSTQMSPDPKRNVSSRGRRLRRYGTHRDPRMESRPNLSLEDVSNTHELPADSPAGHHSSHSSLSGQGSGSYSSKAPTEIDVNYAYGSPTDSLPIGIGIQLGDRDTVSSASDYRNFYHGPPVAGSPVTDDKAFRADMDRALQESLQSASLLHRHNTTDSRELEAAIEESKRAMGSN